MAQPMGPISQAQMPDFNILGLMLGGRSYASGWFEQRDKLKLAQSLEDQHKAEAVQFAQQLQKGPEFNQAMNNPYDRRANFGLWGAMQGGNADQRGLGSDLLRSNIDHIYRREGTQFEDELARQRITLSADEQLRVDQTQRDREAAQKQRQWERVFAPSEFNPGMNRQQEDIMRTLAAKDLGIAVPEDSIVGLNPDGSGIAMMPAPGTKRYGEVMEKMQGQENMIEDAGMLLGHYDGSVQLGKGEYGQYVNNLQFAIKRAEELGTLDAGTSEKLAEVIPEYGTLGTDVMGNAQEKLRVFIKTAERKMQDIAQANIVPIDMAGGVKPQRMVPQDLVEKREKATRGLVERQKERSKGAAQDLQQKDGIWSLPPGAAGGGSAPVGGWGSP